MTVPAASRLRQMFNNIDTQVFWMFAMLFVFQVLMMGVCFQEPSDQSIRESHLALHSMTVSLANVSSLAAPAARMQGTPAPTPALVELYKNCRLFRGNEKSRGRTLYLREPFKSVFLVGQQECNNIATISKTRFLTTGDLRNFNEHLKAKLSSSDYTAALAKLIEKERPANYVDETDVASRFVTLLKTK